MIKKVPVVSVIVPTKNSEKTLAECLQSVKNQTYKNIEIIVVDNNSADDTKKIAKKFTDKVFNKGPERCTQRNYAVKQSTGDYVFIIDSDMKLSPKVVESCLKSINSNVENAGVIVPEESFGEGFWSQCKKLERSFYIGVPFMEAARFFRKDIYLKVGGYDEDMISGEDWDLSQRIEEIAKISRIDELIYHNEGRIALVKTLKKKYYYATMLSKYLKKTDATEKAGNQTSILLRYKLFFNQPKKLFQNPILGIGILFMKTAEFGFGGIGYFVAMIKNKI